MASMSQFCNTKYFKLLKDLWTLDGWLSNVYTEYVCREPKESNIFWTFTSWFIITQIHWTGVIEKLMKRNNVISKSIRITKQRCWRPRAVSVSTRVKNAVEWSRPTASCQYVAAASVPQLSRVYSADTFRTHSRNNYNSTAPWQSETDRMFVGLL